MSDEKPDLDRNLDKPAVFRSFAREAIKNSHASIKACWAILFTGGTFALLRSLDTWYECTFWNGEAAKSGYMHRYCMLPHDATFNFLYAPLPAIFSFVYVLTFYRFYVGNIRVFDMRYNEAFRFYDSIYEHRKKPIDSDIQDEADRKKAKDYQTLLNYNDYLMKIESLVLIFVTFVIVYLTVTILDPSKFLWTYALLLFLDLVWMIALAWGGGREVRNNLQRQIVYRLYDLGDGSNSSDFRRLLEKMLPMYATDRWSYNNLIFLFVILLILVPYELIHWKLILLSWTDNTRIIDLFFFWVGAVAVLLNCVRDLWQTWDFYNPKFGKAHKLLVEMASEGGRAESAEKPPVSAS